MIQAFQLSTGIGCTLRSQTSALSSRAWGEGSSAELSRHLNSASHPFVRAEFPATSNENLQKYIRTIVQSLRQSLEKRGVAFLLPLGLLMLAMAVFVWGLQYKLSLYHGKDAVAHSAPAAKLLSEKERPVTAVSLDAPAPQPVLFPVLPALFLLALTPTLYPASRYLQRLTPDRAPARRSYFLPTLFFRPPPSR
jgi:hypothetical protein